MENRTNFLIETAVPRSWLKVIDNSGRIAWKFDNTLAARWFGKERARSYIARNLMTYVIQSTLAMASGVLIAIGMLKLVPEVLLL